MPPAIKNRLSRFKYCFEIETIQDSEYIYQIIKPLLGELLQEKELRTLSEVLKGEPLDIIKQSCLDKIMSIESNKTKKNKIGFTK